jgi:hypothetical protein
VAPIGLTAANLTGISGTVAALTYSFTWTVPIAQIGDAAAKLQAAGVQFEVTGARFSDTLTSQDRCSTSDLIADARTQAQKMAAAISGTVGPTLSVSNVTTAPLAGGFAGAMLFTGIFVGRPSLVQLPPSTTLNCSLTVKFQLNR